MKKIIINGKFLSQNITGVQRFAREIVLELDKLVPEGCIEIAVPKNAKSVPNLKNIKITTLNFLQGVLWEQFTLPLYAIYNGAITLNLCNASPLLSPGIVNIHDVMIKTQPKSFSKKFVLWYELLFSNAIRRAKLILTVSEFSKSEIIKYYDVSEKKIKVVSNGWQHFNRICFDETALEKYELTKNAYCFAMSSIGLNKNFKWLAEVAKRNPSMVFAIAGSINAKVFQDGIGFDAPSNIKFLGYVSDEEAKTLMRDSRAFLFPSFYEGFGIPPLEAMSAGAKCIVVADIPVMHEIFADGVKYIGTEDYNCDLESLIGSGKTDRLALEKYSWEKSAKKLAEILLSLN